MVVKEPPSYTVVTALQSLYHLGPWAASSTLWQLQERHFEHPRSASGNPENGEAKGSPMNNRQLHHI